MDYFIFGAPIVFLVIFGFMYWKKPYRIINGFVFDWFLFTALVGVMFFFQKHPNIITSILLGIIVIVSAIILLFGIFIIIGYLLVNSIKMARREAISLANSLSLLLLIGIVMQIIISIFFTKYVANKVVLIMFSLIYSVEFYLIISVISFITISIVVHFDRAIKPRDYFVVLGCGLIDGHRVSPLLAGRINRAIDAYNKQKNKGKTAKIIFSGGKGSDEKISEAEAMQAYAIEQGVNAEDTIIENKSVNTLENMMFSKNIMDEISSGDYLCTYVTSDYHLFRAGIYANKAGLRKVKGLGSKTKGYYIPNAMIREYVALFVMNKKLNLSVIGFIFAMYMLLFFLLSFKGFL